MVYTRIKVSKDQYYIAKNDKGITFIGSPNSDADEIVKWCKDTNHTSDNKSFETVRRELEDYLSGKITALTFPIDPIGTAFQRSVWKELQKIPYGETVSYTQIASRLGDAKKVRAVASAIGKNPVLFAIPCHRVIGADGKLRGFRAGLSLKSMLLDMEKGNRR